MELLILLIAAHALCDLPLQGTYLSNAKRGNDPNFPAWLALFYHATIHAGAVLLITHSVAMSLAELMIHFGTDAAKCRGLIGGKVDQSIHIACKLVWALGTLYPASTVNIARCAAILFILTVCIVGMVASERRYNG